MKKLFYLSCFFILLNASKGFSQSTSWKGTTNTFWNNAANWTNGVPDITKDAILGDANFTGVNQPKVNVPSTCKSVTIGGIKPTILTFSRALTVSGNLTINPNGIVLHPGVTTSVSGNFTNNGIYNTTAANATLALNGLNQVIGGSSVTTFRRLIIKVSSVVSLTTDIKIDSTSCTLAVYGTLDPGTAHKVTCTGITKVYDTARLKVSTAAFTSNFVFSGTVTLYAGSIVEYTSSTVNQVVSSAYSYSTLMISGTSTKSLAADLPLLYGKSAPYGKILVNSGTFDLGIYTANRNTTRPGGELNIANGAVLKIGGLNNFPLNFATRTLGASSTVEYNGVDQTVSAQSYGNLLFSTAGIKTATTAFSTAGNLTITNGTFNTNAVLVTHSVAGNFIMTGGAITGTNYTFTLNGTANQSLSATAAILKLNINKTGGTVNLGSDITVSNTLTFTKGNIQTGTYKVVMPATASVAGAGQSTGWVNGNLQKHILTGSAIPKTFEIGNANYSPVNLLFASISIAGDLTATTISVDQPEIDYSGIDPAKSVNRYWSFNNSGIVFTTATATFNWMAADIDGGAITTNFKTGLYNGTGWMLPAVSAPLATSIQATGLTALGDFSVGEKIGKSTWTGNAMTSDWFTPKNWLGLIPSTANPTLIPNGIAGGLVYPILTSGTGIVNDLTIENAASLVINSGTLQIAGILASSNNVTASAGTVEFNGSTSQTIASGSFAGNAIKDLVINNNVSLDNTTIITGTLSVGNGKTFSTNDNLVLRSDANGTARIASLPVDGSGNATAFITGNVSIERYIPARKAWRLLSAPIKTGSTQTIDGAWQEGAYASSSFAPNPNPNPGYGVHIVGGTVENGFDQSTTNSPTLKIYNNAINGFVALPATPGTFVPINSYSGYFLYVRGDRGIDLSQGNNAAVTSTTLRMKGAVNTGSQSSTVAVTNSTLLGNPYASAIDFATITRNNVKNSFYVWDPKLAGSNGLGAYVTVSWNSSTGVYDVTTSASQVSQYIASGEAILVESADGINPGSVVIKESDKTANGSDFLFGRNAAAPSQKLRTNLYSQETDGSSSLLDGALTTYDASNSNRFDDNDVKKLNADGESISFQRENRLLAIERRKTISENDTTFLNIAQMKMQEYKLEIIAEQLDKPGFTAVLKDKFSSELNNTPLNMNGSTEILFSVTDNPASYAADRFSIIFSKSAIPAVFAFKSINASLQQKNIAVEWQTENQKTISNYEVEGSSDGTRFTKLSTLASKINDSAGYSWFDLNASAGDHYYRIRSSALNGEKKYSDVVKVSIAGSTISADSKQMVIYPNPVRNNMASLQLAFLERGMYVIEVSNLNGQLVKRLSLVHNGGTFKYNLPLDSKLSPGKYQVKLTDGATVSFTVPMIKE